MSIRDEAQTLFSFGFHLIHYRAFHLEGNWHIEFTDKTDWGVSDNFKALGQDCSLLLELEDGSKEGLVFKERALIANFKWGIVYRVLWRLGYKEIDTRWTSRYSVLKVSSATSVSSKE